MDDRDGIFLFFFWGGVGLCFLSRENLGHYLLLRFCMLGGESHLVDELNKLLRTTVGIQTAVIPLGVTSSVQTGDMGAAASVIQLVQWDMDLFTVSLPFLTSLVHTAAALTVIDTLAAIAAASLSVFPTQQTTTQIIRDFTESHYQY